METPVEAGKTVQLTVNSDYQRELQNILDGFINNFDSLRNSKTEELGLKKVTCGAIVVLDANCRRSGHGHSADIQPGRL